MKSFNQFMQESQLGGPLPRIKKTVEIQTITQYDVKDKNPNTGKGVEYPTRWVLPKKGIRHTTPIYHTTLRVRGLEV